MIAQAVEATSLRFPLISVYPLQDNGVAKQNAMAGVQITKTLVSETFDNCMSSACLSLDSALLPKSAKRVSDLFLGNKPQYSRDLNEVISTNFKHSNGQFIVWLSQRNPALSSKKICSNRSISAQGHNFWNTKIVEGVLHIFVDKWSHFSALQWHGKCQFYAFGDVAAGPDRRNI